MQEVRIGDCVLIHGDCRDMLSKMGRVDAVVTDPPYGIGQAAGMGSGGFNRVGRRRHPRRYEGDWDSARPTVEAIAGILRLADKHIIWGGNYLADMLPAGGRWLVWDKLNGMPSYSDCELAWTSLPGSRIKKYTAASGGLAANRDGRVHPTQKPVGLMRWCLSQIGEIPARSSILDPYMGSGTMLVACAKMGLSGIGVEIDQGFFEAACLRVEEAYRQADFFTAPTPEPPVQEGLL